jgi:DNA-binding CsgD family transcriptional regulator
MWELPPEIAAKVAEIRARPGHDRRHQKIGEKVKDKVLRRVRDQPDPHGLTVSTYEARVLDLLVEGCTNAEIAERAFLTVATVKTHLQHVKFRTGSRSRTHIAVRYARGDFAVVGLQR